MSLAPACVLYGRAFAPHMPSDSGIVVFAEELLAEAETKADGSYRLTGIPPGTWNVDAITLSPPGLARGSATVAAPGDSTHVADLLVAPTSVPAPLRARVSRVCAPGARERRDFPRPNE